jgi:hypothetical protein
LLGYKELGRIRCWIIDNVSEILQLIEVKGILGSYLFLPHSWNNGLVACPGSLAALPELGQGMIYPVKYYMWLFSLPVDFPLPHIQRWNWI